MSHESYRQDDDLTLDNDGDPGGLELVLGIAMCCVIITGLIVWIEGLVAIMSWLSGR